MLVLTDVTTGASNGVTRGDATGVTSVRTGFVTGATT